MLLSLVLTVDELVLLLGVAVGLAPGAVMVEHTDLPLVSVFPVTALRGAVGIIGGTDL